MFAVTSRYHDIGTAVLEQAGRPDIVYVRRRFLPTSMPPGVLAEHTVVQGDRLDNVTARYLGDPEQYWRICDANDADRPDELTSGDRLGRRLIVPAPDVVVVGR